MSKKNLAKAITLGLLLAMPCQVWANDLSNKTDGVTDGEIPAGNKVFLSALGKDVEVIENNTINIKNATHPGGYIITVYVEDHQSDVKFSKNAMNVENSSVSGITFLELEYAGYPELDEKGSFLNNILTITDTTVTNKVEGIYIKYSFVGNVEGNSVNLHNTNVNGTVNGVYLKNGYGYLGDNAILESTDGVINSNEVNLSGNGIVGSNVTAVRVDEDYWKALREISNNTVTLDDTATVKGTVSAYHNGNNHLALAEIVLPQNKGTVTGTPVIAYNNTLKIFEDWTGQDTDTTSINTLNDVKHFDTIDIGWNEGKELTIKNLTVNKLLNAESEQNKLTFRLNNLDTTVYIDQTFKDVMVFGDEGSETTKELAVEGTGIVRDQMGSGAELEENIKKLAEAVQFRPEPPVENPDTGEGGDGSGETGGTTPDSGTDTPESVAPPQVEISTDEGVLYGSLKGTYTASEDGTGEGNVVITENNINTSNAGVNEMTSLGLISWRAETNDMNKRMGELRNANGEHGVWVRMVRGEAEYKSIKNQYNQYQLGYDEKLSVDKRWTVGAAISYTDAENNFKNGSGESENKALAIYGSKLNDDGSFVDLIAKYGRLENDFKLAGGIEDADYSTNAYSLSAEFGKRIQQGKGLWIEPQVELTYGKVSNVTYTAKSGAVVAQDSMESLIGRVGFSLGKDIKQGNVYARASYLYDFDGEANATMSHMGNSVKYENDLGGGWWEVGVGANINLSDATYIYADVEKTFGGEVDTNWQWNLGVRYSF